MRTEHEAFDSIINLVLDDTLTLKDIVTPLQAYIQKYGPLDENNPKIKEFLKKIGKA